MVQLVASPLSPRACIERWTTRWCAFKTRQTRNLTCMSPSMLVQDRLCGVMSMPAGQARGRCEVNH